MRRAIEAATAASIADQVEAGVDIGNDGEQARESFVTYVQHRMTGFGGESQRPFMRDLAEHPDFLELAAPRFARIKVSLMRGARGRSPRSRTGTPPSSRRSARSWPARRSPRRS